MALCTVKTPYLHALHDILLETFYRYSKQVCVREGSNAALQTHAHSVENISDCCKRLAWNKLFCTSIPAAV